MALACNRFGLWAKERRLYTGVSRETGCAVRLEHWTKPRIHFVERQDRNSTPRAQSELSREASFVHRGIKRSTWLPRKTRYASKFPTTSARSNFSNLMSGPSIQKRPIRLTQTEGQRRQPALY
jgi:hypothetical protein